MPRHERADQPVDGRGRSPTIDHARGDDPVRDSERTRLRIHERGHLHDNVHPRGRIRDRIHLRDRGRVGDYRQEVDRMVECRPDYVHDRTHLPDQSHLCVPVCVLDRLRDVNPARPCVRPQGDLVRDHHRVRVPLHVLVHDDVHVHVSVRELAQPHDLVQHLDHAQVLHRLHTRD